MTRLEENFHLANSRYFGGRLKNVKVKLTTRHIGGRRRSAVGVTHSSPEKVHRGERKFLIEISSDLKIHPSMTILTLFHEMVHVKQWDKVTNETCHGRLFNKEMKRLAAAGAFNGLW